MQIGNLIRWETRVGERVPLGGLSLRPQSQALIVRWPNGGYVWNRPVAVLVERGGQVERVPIPDVTLVARVFFLGFGLVLSGLALLYPVLKRGG